jgi:hypothetical protein
MDRRNMRIKDNELKEINGGGIGATFIGYLTDALKAVYNIGQEFGGAVRRIATGNTCPL